MEETTECGDPAEFRVGEGEGSFVFCKDHASAANAAGVQAKEISRKFVCSKKCDFELFAVRKQLAECLSEKGMLISRLVTDEKAKAEQAIQKAKLRTVQLVECAYEEVSLRLQERFRKLSLEIDTFRGKIGTLLLSKTAKITAFERLLCKEIQRQTGFLVSSMDNQAIPIVKAILTSVVIESESIESLLQSVPKLPQSPNSFYEETISIQKRLCTLLTSTIDDHTLTAVISHYESSALSLHRSDPKKRSYLDKALYLLISRYPKSERTAVSAFEQGKLLLERYQLLPESQHFLSISVDIERRTDPNSNTLMRNLSFLGRSYIEGDRISSAKACLKEAVSIGKTHFPQSEVTYIAKAMLAGTLLKKKPDKATSILNEVISDNPNPHSESCAIALKLLADSDRYCYSFTESEEKYRRAIEIFELNSSESVHYANALGNLGFLYDLMSRYTESIAVYQRATGVMNAVRPGSLPVSRLLNNTANIYESLNQLEKAEEMYMEALAISEKFPGTDVLSDTYHNLGSLYEKTDRLEAAESMRLKSVSILTFRLPVSAYVSESYWQLGDLYVREAKLQRAEIAYVGCMRKHSSLVESKNVEPTTIVSKLRAVYTSLE